MCWKMCSNFVKVVLYLCMEFAESDDFGFLDSAEVM